MKRDSERPQTFFAFLVLGWPIVVLGAIWLVVEVSGGLETASGFLIESSPDGSQRVSLWFRVLFVVLVLLAVSAIQVLITNGVVKISRARSELHRTVTAIEAIVKGLYDINKPRMSFTSVRGQHIVHANGDGEVTVEYEITAGAMPVQVWPYRIAPDLTGKKVEWLDEINLKVECIDGANGHQAIYLLNRDEPLRKEIAIFFVPEIEPNASRKIRISYQWPGFARDLIVRGSTRFTHTFKSSLINDYADVVYRYVFSANLGELQFARLSALQEGDSLERFLHKETGLTGWKYENKQLLVTGRQLQFVVSKQR